MENLEPKILSILSDKVRIANDKNVSVADDAGEVYSEPDAMSETISTSYT